MDIYEDLCKFVESTKDNKVNSVKLSSVKINQVLNYIPSIKSMNSHKYCIQYSFISLWTRLIRTWITLVNIGKFKTEKYLV